MNYKKKILIDLDGVLNDYKGNYDEEILPEMKRGAREFLAELSKTSELYLFTTRNLMMAAKWLIQNGLDNYFKDITNTKIPSFLYVDDRCVCFRGEYDKTLKEISEFQVYWK